jgi:hypothetical protein
LPAIELTLSVFPRAGDALHVGLAAQLAFRADLAGNARHLAGKGPELVHHGVDGARRAQELALERPPVDVERHALAQVALRHRADDARHLARGVNEVFNQGVDGFDRVAPKTRDIPERCTLLELAFLADHAAQARQLHLLARVEFDQVVECIGNLARQAVPTERQPDRGVAFFYRQQGGENGNTLIVVQGCGRVPGTVCTRAIYGRPLGDLDRCCLLLG